MLGGVIAGYPMVDVRVILVDGSYHEVDSSEMAFKVAGSIGFKEARKAEPVLLEPIMKVEVTTPEEYLGDVIGDLNARQRQDRGHRGKREHPGCACLFVPLSEMFGYATDLRSATQGRATYSMHFSHYEPVPTSIGETLTNQ